MEQDFKPDFGISYFDALKKYVALQYEFHTLYGRYKFALGFAFGVAAADILFLITYIL